MSKVVLSTTPCEVCAGAVFMWGLSMHAWSGLCLEGLLQRVKRYRHGDVRKWPGKPKLLAS